MTAESKRPRLVFIQQMYPITFHTERHTQELWTVAHETIVWEIKLGIPLTINY